MKWISYEKVIKLSNIDPYFMKKKDLIFLVQYFLESVNLKTQQYYEVMYQHSFAHSKYMDCRFKLADTYKTTQVGNKHLIDNSLKMQLKRVILRIQKNFYFKKMTKLEKELFKYKEVECQQN